MNIQIQLCGLFMLALLFIFYKSTKTLHLYKKNFLSGNVHYYYQPLPGYSFVSFDFLPYTLSSSICQLCMQGLPCHFDMGCFNCAYLFFCGSFHQKKASKNRPLFTYSGIIPEYCYPFAPNSYFFQPKENLHLWSFCKLCVFFCFPLYFSNIIFCHWLC